MKIRILCALSLLLMFLFSCERHNVFYETETGKTQLQWKQEQLDFSTHFYHFKGNELTINFWISNIYKTYNIDTLSIKLYNQDNNKEIPLNNIKCFDGMNMKIINTSTFDSLPLERKKIGPEIRTYYALNHIYHINNINDIDDFNLKINCQISNAENKNEVILISKDFTFERGREFLPLPLK